MTDTPTVRVEHYLPREDVADYLDDLAEKLREGGPIEFEAGDTATELEPQGDVELIVRARRDSRGRSPVKNELRVNVQWEYHPGPDEDERLRIG